MMPSEHLYSGVIRSIYLKLPIQNSILIAQSFHLGPGWIKVMAADPPKELMVAERIIQHPYKCKITETRLKICL